MLGAYNRNLGHPLRILVVFRMVFTVLIICSMGCYCTVRGLSPAVVKPEMRVATVSKHFLTGGDAGLRFARRC